jgi:hypothetical protein
MTTRKTRRPPHRNPKVGQHPDMFLPREYGHHPDILLPRESDVVVDVENMSREDVLRAAHAGSLTQDDLDVIEELDPDLREEVDDVSTAGREERIKPVMSFFKEYMWKDRLEEIEEGGDQYEHAWDSFQRNGMGGSMRPKTREVARTILAGTAFEGISDDALNEALEDSDVYSFSLQKGDHVRSSALWTSRVGEQTEELMRGEPDSLMEDIAGLWPEDLREVRRLLENDGIYLEFNHKRYSSTPSEYKKAFQEDPVKSFKSGFTITYAEPADWHYEAAIDKEKFLAALSGVAGVEEEEDVVYRYAGTNDAIGGSSSRGHYVVALKPSQLAAEGRALGICVGRTDMGYKRRLQNGSISLYSIRTEAGKSKFCIEVGTGQDVYATPFTVGPLKVVQVKGKGNRIPGFTLEKPETLSKPDEVRLVTEFLVEGLGLAPENIKATRDLKPGILALQANNVDPFAPPVVRRRLKANPDLVPPRVERLAAQAMSKPWGGVWGTGEDDVQENPAESLAVEEGLSPLEYDRADDVRRYALVDLSAGPPKRGDAYFAELRSVTRIGKTGKPLKKPRETVTPGAASGVVAFIDWSLFHDGSVYIHYMKTRQDARGKRHIQRLLDHLYTQHGDAPMIDWGRVMNAHAWELLKRYRELEADGYPHTTGKNMSV